MSHSSLPPYCKIIKGTSLPTGVLLSPCLGNIFFAIKLGCVNPSSNHCVKRYVFIFNLYLNICDFFSQEEIGSTTLTPGACIIKLITAVIYSLRNKLDCLSLNTRLGWKVLPGTNTLSYYGNHKLRP